MLNGDQSHWLSAEIWHGLGNAPEDLRDTVITIGVFDDIHLGHKHLVAATVSDTRARDVKSLLMTFDPNPVALFTPDKVPPALLTVSRRTGLAKAEGIDIMLVVPFDKTFSSIPVKDFIRTVVRDKLNAQAIFAGQNFTCSQRTSGTAEILPKHGRKYGVDITIVDLLGVTAADSTERISSTHIRGLLADRVVSVAASRLGYFHRVDGGVIPGQERGGAQLGFLTADIDFAEGLVIPTDGVYVAWFTAQSTTVRPESDPKSDIEFGVRCPAAVLVGTNMTFGDTDRTVEAYVIDRRADLYGAAGQVEFVDRIRGMEKFDSAKELIDRMSQDVAGTEIILAKTN